MDAIKCWEEEEEEREIDEGGQDSKVGESWTRMLSKFLTKHFPLRLLVLKGPFLIDVRNFFGNVRSLPIVHISRNL